MDLPIAIGILLVFLSSTWTYATRGGNRSYFDTLNIFIALMLVGRFLQERVVSKNRAMLLASDGAEGLYTRRLGSDGVVKLERCMSIREGDVLVAGRGDIVPVDSILLEEASSLFSLDWISGESAPRTFEPGAVVPAGAFSQGESAVRLKTRADFDASTLVALLRTSTRRTEDSSRSTRWHKRLTGFYVLGVLSLASLGCAGWLLSTRDVLRTIDVVAAVLIVTCPCAFGIATPLAYELAQGKLRRSGLFVRTSGFLDRALEVTRVVFDKTGTLTTGRLKVAKPEALNTLAGADLRRLYAMVVRSSHPKSRAIAAAIESRGAPSFGAADVREILGKGIELREEGSVYRIGAAAWALASAKVPSLEALRSSDVLYTRDGELVASIAVSEELRSDAASEIQELQREGYEAWILSGDGPEATLAMAHACGVPPERAVSGCSPEGKSAWLKDHGDKKTLFIGDGINDSLVAEEAYCAGTPAIDRPFLASRSDFYFVTPGLRPIRHALAMAGVLSRTVKVNLLVALFYNGITVSLALAGKMTPLLCAVLMPLSSLSTVLTTTALLSSVDPTSTRTTRTTRTTRSRRS
jgi:Cu2+-exporting ATPase